MLPSLGLPAFSSGVTMMSMPQAAPSAYPGLQGLWGPVTQPPPAGTLLYLNALFRVSHRERYLCCAFLSSRNL